MNSNGAGPEIKQRLRRSRHHRSGWYVLALLLPSVCATATVEEYTIKAGLVFNFIKFIDWPTTAFVNDSDPYRLCIFSPKDVSTSFSQLEKHSAKGRAIKVAMLTELTPITVETCHILYTTETADTQGFLGTRLAPNQPVLTIGETELFARDGGIINFVVVDNRVKFEINTGAARARQLRISSKLSALAVQVFDSGGPG